MADVIWTSSAFKVLEALPEPIAFGIFKQTEYLQRFPEIGAQISQLKHLSKYRQLIYKNKKLSKKKCLNKISSSNLNEINSKGSSLKEPNN